MDGEPVFIDWLTAVERHPGGDLPILIGGLVVFYDRFGNVRRERTSAASVGGSFDTAVRVGCDGSRVYISGNVGRFAREDNLFNYGWRGTLNAANRILLGAGLPALGSSLGVPGSVPGDVGRGARVLRLDVTANYATGSEAQGRALIRWLCSRSISRAKRGQAGDSSVWFGNTRKFVKAYLKAPELVAHGMSPDEQVVHFCQVNGVVRVEVELKRRLLQDLGLDQADAITDAKLRGAFDENTEILRRVDRSEDPDLLASIPSRSRAYAAAWLAGQDLKAVCSRATLFRHARVLREYGIDILEPRNIEQFPTKVRVIDLQPLAVPEWYRKLLKVA